MTHRSKNRLEVQRLRTFFMMEGVECTGFHRSNDWYYFETDYVPEHMEHYVECWRAIYTDPLKGRLNRLITLALIGDQ